MRVVLFFCLLGLFFCKSGIIETAECLITNKKVQEIGIKLFSILYNKDFSKLLPTLINSFPDLYNAYLQCTKETDDIILKDGVECRDWWGYIACCVPIAIFHDCNDCHAKNCK